ncbi:hypothetical protein ZP9_00009 [Shewanella phage ZP9]|nr:hypothetical protein ZP9_00009 [Shewanella phage ZP9]
MSESKELLVIESVELVPFFTKGEGIDAVLEQIAKEARSIVYGDISTKKGQDAVKAVVTKVTRSKTYLEAQGKALAAEYKEIPKKIDSNRKQVWDFLEALQKEIRQPLTDWEAEQARLKAEEEARLAAIENQRIIDADYEIAVLLMERDFKARAEAAAERDRLRLEHEENIRKQAAEQARLDAERKAEDDRIKAENERLAAERRELEAKQAAQLAEQRRIQQEQQAKIDAELAEQKRLADVEAARQAEIAKQQAAIEAQKKLEAERLANVEHVKQVRTTAINDLVKAGVPHEFAVIAIKAINAKSVSNVSINY